MNAYNVSIGQLITLWVFGGFYWFSTFLHGLDGISDPTNFVIFLLIFIPGFLIFYTLGVNKYRKENKKH